MRLVLVDPRHQFAIVLVRCCQLNPGWWKCSSNQDEKEGHQAGVVVGDGFKTLAHDIPIHLATLFSKTKMKIKPLFHREESTPYERKFRILFKKELRGNKNYSQND